MDISCINREICGVCSKQIYTHHRVLVCYSCNEISHFKCSRSTYTYNHVSDQWSCNNCASDKTNRYAPFESICFNKYLVDEPDAYVEIEKIKAILKNCKVFTKNELDRKFFGYSKEPFSVCYNNIDGMAQNFDTLHSQLSTINNSFDLIAIAETNIADEHKNLYRIPGYQSIFNSKINGKHKGSGMGIYAKDNLNCSKIEEISISCADIETLFIKISNTEQPLIFAVTYRPPSGNIKNFNQQFEKVLEKLSSNYADCHTIITGDFNINLFKNNSNRSKFENIFFGNCYAPLISLATHDKPGCEPSCIDNVLVTMIDNVLGSGVSPELKVSHHFPVTCFFDLSINKENQDNEKNYPSYDYCESNIIEFNDNICKLLEAKQFSSDEKGFAEFSMCINETVDECFRIDPATKLKSKRNRLDNPWVTNGLIKSINYKNFLYKKWKSSKNSKDKLGDLNIYEKYKNYRKKLTYLIRAAKNMFYSKKFDQCKGNSKQTWQLINELRGKCKNKVKSSFIINGTEIKNRRLIADEFNKYFTSVAAKLNDYSSADNGIPIIEIPHFSKYIGKRISDSMYFEPCTADELDSIIKDLDNSKASDIPIRVLKICKQTFIPYLTIFFNKFIELGIFPGISKIGQITPIFKKGDPQLMQNYRPISTLPCLGKIFEKVIYTRLYKFCISKKIIYENQFGFRSHHSTTHAVNYSIDKIIHNIENKNHVLGIFIDLSKAFDTINHDKLIHKLENYGIRGLPLQLLKSYMNNRKQLTNFGGLKSNLETIIFGVPQGSVLGPLLFLIYINDIVQSSSLGHFVLFADDTNIFVTANSEKEVYTKANELLREINLYMLSNQLHINTEKCIYMYFRPRLNNNERKTCARIRVVGSDHLLLLNGQKIKKTDKARFLGIVIDENLNWDMHLEHIEQKLNSCIITIKRIKKFIPKDHYKKLYHTLFESHLTYGITAWGSCSPYKLNKIFSIQKRCLRLLFGKQLNYDHAEYYKTCARARPYNSKQKLLKNFVLEHTKPLFKEYNLLTVQNLHKLYTINEIFKIQKYRYPISLCNFLHSQSNTPRQGRKNQLILPNYRLNISRSQFLFCGIDIWNNLVAGLDLLTDFSISTCYVKKKFKEILTKKQNLGSIIHWEKHNLRYN